jgi:hypothetical protein
MIVIQGWESLTISNPPKTGTRATCRVREEKLHVSKTGKLLSFGTMQRRAPA